MPTGELLQVPLLRADDLHSRSSNLPPWLLDAYEQFRVQVLHSRYPCYFGTAAERRGELRYAGIEADDWQPLPQLLEHFLNLSRKHPQTRHALAVFFAPDPDELSLEGYRRRFWKVLGFLADNDPARWPADLPSDPDHPQWQFCFDGEPMFVFASCPAHHLRVSRNLGAALVLLFQPRRVFDGIEGGTSAGTRARRAIRERGQAWDAVDAHPDMGSYGDPSSLEWKQYFLPDDNTPVAGRCPLRGAPGRSQPE